MYRAKGRPIRYPIIRVGIKDAAKMIRSNDYELYPLAAGHAELIDKKDGGAFAYITKQTFEKLRQELGRTCRLIQWSERFDVNGKSACPRCFQPAEQVFSMRGGIDWAHKSV